MTISEDDALTHRKRVVLIFCVGIFVTCLVLSAITAQKLYFISILSWEVAVPVGTSLFALTFLATDVLSEVYGRAYALTMVFVGFVCRALVLFFLWFAVWVEPVPYFGNQEAYSLILGSEGAGRIVIAGLVTYIVSQTADVLIFDYMRRREQGQNKLYVRNLTSTFISQFLDTVLFVSIAFGGVLPLSVILGVIAGQLVVKWAIAIADTPFVYLIKNIALKRNIFSIRD